MEESQTVSEARPAQSLGGKTHNDSRDGAENPLAMKMGSDLKCIPTCGEKIPKPLMGVWNVAQDH